MIVEGLVTTIDSAGRLNIAPMGPRVDGDFRTFELRPFQSSTTYRNLKGHREGVFHVTDDVLLLAKAAVGTVFDAPSRSAEKVAGFVLTETCRYFEFRVTGLDDTSERATFHVETVHQATFRDFLGFNRAKHAVLEAAILATRASFLDLDDVADEFVRIQEIVKKTGGTTEHEALGLLKSHVIEQAKQRGLASDLWDA